MEDIAIERLLRSNEKVFYKITKSSKEIAHLFYEDYYKPYPENSRVSSKSDSGLSFCVNKEKLLSCVLYGDTLTQIIVDKDYTDINQLKIDNYRFGLEEDIRLFSECRAKTLNIGFNFSFADVSVLKECILYADNDSIHKFFNFRHYDKNGNGFTIEEIYKSIGYFETYDFLQNIRQLYNIYKFDLSKNLTEFKDKVKANMPEKENDFSFVKAKQFYLKTKNKTTPPFQKNTKIGIITALNKDENLTKFYDKDIVIDAILFYKGMGEIDTDISKVDDKTIRNIINDISENNKISEEFVLSHLSQKQIEDFINNYKKKDKFNFKEAIKSFHIFKKSNNKIIDEDNIEL